jgi:hypothetical protein
MIMWVGSSGEDKEGDGHDLEPVPSFAKVQLLTKLLNHSFTHIALASMMNKMF